jgi:2,3,4,5-tetrahydropyridine-2-carboxylate N-succinyltransferase
MTDTQNLRSIIENAWENRALLSEDSTKAAIHALIEALDKGQIRVAEPKADGSGWIVNEWVKKGVILYSQFSKLLPILLVRTICDKIP